ncbi:hypothetical protein TBR22_A18140 [Luteitalea sp. TBR-22]|uniref:DUF3455 domain-containing protein n=1 Tax=Luteitalea sp. TBR-22 TaxID=2802971 RepID=UPI001AF857B4|nr:DUF3455 domain-containing protein [Luteitalea sp. TBR-22]BCS32600.1 hypothetical protein TBR22_A18140 [Luteitalea sp. TBR-22]
MFRHIIPFAAATLLATAVVHAQPPAGVPAGLEPPAGVHPYLTLHAEGTQNYMCVLSPTGFGWLFYGPQATLTGADEAQVATHFLSPNPDQQGAARPTWQHSGDTSAIWAAAIASSTDPAFVAPGAIPWLLLAVVGDEAGPGGGTFFPGTTHIQRVNTAGGQAPATGCKTARDVGKKALVPYSTDYVFYR